jgi:hypothetical protein
MFSKEEARLINQKFWDDFSNFMSKIRSSNGRKINWLNYPSDVKTVFVRLEVDSKHASLCFDIQHKDDELRAIIWEQMTELKMVMEDTTIIPPTWSENYYYLNKQYISRISWDIQNVNIHKAEDKEIIFEFLKERLIKFDLFYQEYKEILMALAN